MSESVIRVDGLKKSFDGPPVLDGVSFEVRRGETFALLGRNGAGKTTTIRILLGLLKPDAGTVEVAGCDPQARPLDVRSRVGYLAEDQAMYEWMTPVELCRFLQPFYPTWDEKLASELLERFELPRQQRIEHLSKGQTVKLGLAVALAYRPEIAILDDPALGLDPIARKEFNRDLIDWLQAEGRTVIYSSHLLDEVETVADRVAILDAGRIVRLEQTEVLRERVQRVMLPIEKARLLPAPEGLLDVRQHAGHIEVVVDGIDALLRDLTQAGVESEPAELTLDEIFAAFVIGRTDGWPEAPAPVTAS
ncbi:MAG: ABC transporter ATP-binding protein [Maioricimonas sp. JB049]